MKIISKFKDYYDCIQSYGIDDKVKYIRKESKKTIDSTRSLGRGLFRDDEYFYDTEIDKISWHGFIIGVCGQLYRGVSISAPTTSDYSIDMKGVKNKFICFYNTTQIENYYINHFDNYKKTQMFQVKCLSFYRKSDTLFEDFKNTFNMKIDKQYYDYFIKYKVPVFSIHRDFNNNHSNVVLNLNCPLSKYQFQKVKQPYEIYQEIYQYISGVLGVGEPQIITLTDKDKIQKKGFDKWSFRKMPIKKK
jgi:hypothetical protein